MQLQITNEEDYKLVKENKNCLYASDLTHIVEINLSAKDPLFTTIKKYIDQNDSITNKKVSNDDNKWELTWMANAIVILTHNTQLAEYVGGYIKDGYLKVPSESWWKVWLLLDAGFLIPTGDFKEKFQPMTDKSKLSESFVFYQKTNYRNKKWSFSENYNKAGLDSPDIQIGSCKFLKEKTTIRNTKVISGFPTDISSDAKKVQFKTSSGDIFELEMRGWQRFRRSNYIEGQDMRIMSSSAGPHIINPIILPSFLGFTTEAEINKFENKFGFVSNRMMPVDLTNKMKAEIWIRLKIGEMENK